MSSGDCEVVTGLVLVTLGAIVMIVIGPIIISEKNHLDRYDQALCVGFDDINIENNLGHYYCSGISNIVNNMGNVIGKATIHYPALNHYLDQKSDNDCHSLIASMSTPGTHVCYVSDKNSTNADGYIVISSIAGYIAMTVLAVLFLVTVIIVFCVIVFGNVNI